MTIVTPIKINTFNKVRNSDYIRTENVPDETTKPAEPATPVNPEQPEAE
jgi:hypothetical protein